MHIESPLKIQGRKTRLLDFLRLRLPEAADRRFVEPFCGSGTVGLNLAGDRALLCDINPHIIRFWQSVQAGEITGQRAEEHLLTEGRRLASVGARYYYDTIRPRFNEQGDPLDLLLLSRLAFSGIMRFSPRGYNVPLGYSCTCMTEARRPQGWRARSVVATGGLKV